MSVDKAFKTWLDKNPNYLNLHSKAAFASGYEAGRKDLRAVVAEAGIVLEALWAAEHDGIALSPGMKESIANVIPMIREAIK